MRKALPRIWAALLASVVISSGAIAFAQEVSIGAFGINGEPLQMRDHELNALSLGEAAPERRLPVDGNARRLELEVAANAGPVDVAIAQRAHVNNAATERSGAGTELRIGRGLVERREGGEDSVYVFVASDNEALTWAPGSSAGAPLALQQQVEVGDRSAGVTLARGGVQTSVAYVERESSTRVGAQTISRDQSFAGVTVTVRR